MNNLLRHQEGKSFPTRTFSPSQNQNDGVVLQNWAQVSACRPSHIHYPEQATEIAEILQYVSKTGSKVKVLGAGHSPSDIAMSDAHIIRLDRLNQVLEVDSKNHRVRVQAGILVKDLNSILWSHGLALRNLGSISDQTLGGLIATGTHGSGIRYPMLACDVLEMRIMDTRGQIVQCSREVEPDVFKASLVSLGVLGVVLELVIQCEPAYNLREEQVPMPLTHVLRDLDKLRANAEHFRFCWCPHTDHTFVVHLNRTADPVTPPRTSFRDRVVQLVRHFVSVRLLEFAYLVALRCSWLIPWINRLWRRMLWASRTVRVGRSFDIFNFDCLFKQYVNEWCIPQSRCADALLALQNLIRTANYKVHLPVEVRFISGDDAWLSPAYNMPDGGCYIGIIMYRPFGQDVEHKSYFRDFDKLMHSMGGRPHWAKICSLAPHEIRSLYPRWQDYERVRQRMDPHNLLVNAWAARLFGASSTK